MNKDPSSMPLPHNVRLPANFITERELNFDDL